MSVKCTKQDTLMRQNRSAGRNYGVDENGVVGPMRSSVRENTEKGDGHS